MLVLKWYLEKFDIKPSGVVLSVLAWCEKEAYSVTGMENNLRLFSHGSVVENKKKIADKACYRY